MCSLEKEKKGLFHEKRDEEVLTTLEKEKGTATFRGTFAGLITQEKKEGGKLSALNFRVIALGEE